MSNVSRLHNARTYNPTSLRGNSNVLEGNLLLLKALMELAEKEGSCRKSVSVPFIKTVNFI